MIHDISMNIVHMHMYICMYMERGSLLDCNMLETLGRELGYRLGAPSSEFATPTSRDNVVQEIFFKSSKKEESSRAHASSLPP